VAVTWVIVLALCGQGTDEGIKAFRALLREYDQAMEAFNNAMKVATTPAQREAAYREKHPKNGDYAVRCLAIAKAHPKSLAAVDALIWAALHPVEAALPASRLRGKALRQLLDDYPSDARLALLCTRLVLAVDPDSEAFLKTVAEKAKGESLSRAIAARAQNLKNRAGVIRMLKEEKDARADFERLWGKDAIAALMRGSPEKLEKESIAQFETVVAKHADLKHPTHGNLGAFAKANLLALREPVTVGKKAPEIAGKGLSGEALKLSTYRGKVVLIDFYAHGLDACRDMFATEKLLVKRYASKPFVLLGVNGDAGQTQTRLRNKAAGLAWPTWYDGGGLDGPIATRWEVDRWPTIVLIDHEGVVRHIWTGWPDVKELAKAITALVEKAEKKK
jgi:peroxiredoxin